MKIAISGKMCSGKTTLANKIKEEDNRYKIYSFGSKVKELATDLFGMDINNKDRSLLISIGTKMREINKDVWVNYILEKTKDEEFCIIDDLRFQNELDLLEKNNWKIIHLDIDKEIQIERIKNIYINYQDHIKNMDDLSEKLDLKYKNDYILIKNNQINGSILTYIQT